jgi:hypothetical protein
VCSHLTTIRHLKCIKSYVIKLLLCTNSNSMNEIWLIALDSQETYERYEKLYFIFNYGRVNPLFEDK